MNSSTRDTALIIVSSECDDWEQLLDDDFLQAKTKSTVQTTAPTTAPTTVQTTVQTTASTTAPTTSAVNSTVNSTVNDWDDVWDDKELIQHEPSFKLEPLEEKPKTEIKKPTVPQYKPKPAASTPINKPKQVQLKKQKPKKYRDDDDYDGELDDYDLNCIATEQKFFNERY